MAGVDRRSEPNIQRLLLAFRRQIGDRIPFWDVIYALPSDLVESIIGVTVPQEEYSVSAQLQLQVARRLGMDTIGFYGGWSLGGEIYGVAGNGKRQYQGGSLKPSTDLSELPPLDLDGLQRRLDHFIRVAEPANAGVFVSLPGVVHSAYYSIGYEHLCLLLYDDLPFVKQVMDISMDRNRRIVEVLCRYPLSFIRLVDHVAISTGPMFQPDTLKSLWLPRTRELIAPAKEAGVLLEWHCCGQADWALPYVIELGFHAIDPIQPECSDIYAIHRRFGDELTLMGSISVDLLMSGTPEAVEINVTEMIHRLGRKGGFVLKGSGSAPGVLAENYSAMARAVQKHGGFDSLKEMQ
jgi:hypothetical protein